MRWLTVLAVMIVACGGRAAAPSPSDGASESSPNPTVCGDSAFFTACVQQCGEKNDREPTAARCVGGALQCDTPLIPAATCGPGSWTSARLPCGPWVDGYDCLASCALCDSVRGWTCGSCPDASPGDAS
jgi:hypothetical protein